MTESKRRVWLGVVLLLWAMLTLPMMPVLWRILHSTNFNYGALLVAMSGGLSWILALLTGTGLILEKTRFSSAVLLTGRLLLLLLLIGTLLNLAMTLPAALSVAQEFGATGVLWMTSLAINNVVFLMLLSDANTVISTRGRRTCPWRLTVWVSLAVLVPMLGALASLGGPQPTGLRIEFGTGGGAFVGFPFYPVWNGVMAAISLLTLLAAAQHHRLSSQLAYLAAVGFALLLPLGLSRAHELMNGFWLALPGMGTLCGGLVFLFYWLGREMQTAGGLDRK